jgi:hypothetical protein
MGTEIPKLRRLCRKWGGDLREVTPEEFDQLKDRQGLGKKKPTFYEAPFSHRDLGILWKRKLVIYAGDVAWVEVIHEMGHVFACRTNPDQSDEFPFLGWEIALVNHIKGNLRLWLAENKDYQTTNEGQSLGSMSPLEQGQLVAERLVVARQTGILGPGDRPLALR